MAFVETEPRGKDRNIKPSRELHVLIVRICFVCVCAVVHMRVQALCSLMAADVGHSMCLFCCVAISSVPITL